MTTAYVPSRSGPHGRVAVEMSPEELSLVWQALSRELQHAPARDPRREQLATLLIRVRDHPHQPAATTP